MSTANEVLLSGRGSLERVAEECISVLNADSVEMVDCREAADALRNLLESADGKRAAFTLACAVINRQFVGTGWMLSTGPTGVIKVEYVADNSLRQLIADSTGM